MKNQQYPITIIISLFLIFWAKICLGQNHDKIPEAYSDQAFEVLTEIFNYDTHEPLEVKVVLKQNFGNYTREKIVFSGNRNSRVPGYIAYPNEGEGPYPVIVLLHAGSSSKDNWWASDNSNKFKFEKGGGSVDFERGESLIDSLIYNGFAVVALDAEYHGERLLDNDFVSIFSMYFDQQYLHKYKELQIQSVIEYRRIIDYINTRADLDEEKMGIMGMSMGGMMGTILMSLEEQIKVGVLCSTPLRLEGNSPIIFPVHYAPRVRNNPAILYIYGANDRMIPKKDAEQFFTILNTTQKEINQLNGGHQPSLDYVKLSIQWIKKHLK